MLSGLLGQLCIAKLSGLLGLHSTSICYIVSLLHWVRWPGNKCRKHSQLSKELGNWSLSISGGLGADPQNNPVTIFLFNATPSSQDFQTNPTIHKVPFLLPFSRYPSQISPHRHLENILHQIDAAFLVLMMEYIEECVPHLSLLRFCETKTVQGHLTVRFILCLMDVHFTNVVKASTCPCDHLIGIPPERPRKYQGCRKK